MEVQPANAAESSAKATKKVFIEPYQGEHQIILLKKLIEKDLSEPYSLYTYRYFLEQWPELGLLAMEQVDPEHDHEALNSNYTYDIVMRTGSSTSVAKDQAGSNNSRTSNGNEVKMECIGCIVCKLEKNRHDILRGYIAMLAIRHDRRKHGLASTLVTTAIQKMFAQGCEEVVLEAEHVNGAALKLYEKLGFVRDKLLEKYYLNGSDAYRLKLKLDPNKDWGTDLQ